MNRPARDPGKRPVLLVTGGAKRVGAECCRHFARLGYDIALTYRNSEAEANALIAELPTKAIPIRADFTPDGVVDAVADVTEAVGEHFGRLDILLHNASLYEPSNLWDTTVEQLRRFMTAHVEAPLLLTRALVPLLKMGTDPLVCCATDIQVDRPFPEYAGYCASKAALANLVKSMARELAHTDATNAIRVNAIAPGVVEWPPGTEQAEIDTYLGRVPLGRSGEPADFAGALEALANMPYVTGQTINVDGGRSIRA
ncbi:MAG: SDR family oxidoreductase [Planctomycetota bacterium]